MGEGVRDVDVLGTMTYLCSLACLERLDVVRMRSAGWVGCVE